VLVLVGTGSKYEKKETNGVSHFLEHMFFKGTEKRPRAVDISSLLDGVGGEFNAFTSEEFTGYYVKVATAHFDLALDVVSDILLHSKFDPKEINRERGVIIEELNMNRDNPMRHVLELWTEVLYGDQPAGWPIGGTKQTVSGILRDNIISYFKQQYVGNNTIVVVAGNTDNGSALVKAKKYFTPLKKGNSYEKDKVVELQRCPAVLLHTKQTDQTHICVGVRGFHTFDHKKYVAEVIATILGGGMSSRMFISVRERKGLVYYISTTSDSDTDAGSLYTRAGIDNSKVEQAVRTIIGEYRRLKRTKVSPKELAKAKNYLRGKTYLALEASDDVAEFLGGQEMLENRILSPEEILEQIDAVTPAKIQEVAQEIFRPEKVNLALVGPFENTAKFEKLLSDI
jgi:predicted Zn-dependent peptidase